MELLITVGVQDATGQRRRFRFSLPDVSLVELPYSLPMQSTGEEPNRNKNGMQDQGDDDEMLNDFS